MRRVIIRLGIGLIFVSLASFVASAAYGVTHLFSSSPITDLLMIGSWLSFVGSMCVLAVALQWDSGFRYVLSRDIPLPLRNATVLTRIVVAMAILMLLLSILPAARSLIACSPFAAWLPWSAILSALSIAVLVLVAWRLAARAGVSNGSGIVVVMLFLTPVTALTLSVAFDSAECAIPGTSPAARGPNGWRTAASMQTARSNHRSVLLGNGQVLVLGGRRASSAEVYDPSADRWFTLASPGPATGSFALVALRDGRALYVDSTRSAVFDADRGIWTTTLASHPAEDTALTLADGRVVLLGENGGEVFDPPTGRWQRIPGPVEAGRIAAGTAWIRHHAAVIVGGTAVLVPGVPQSYLLDPDAATWHEVDPIPLKNPRTTTILQDGTALIIATGSDREAVEVIGWNTVDRKWSDPTVLLCGAACYAESGTILADGTVLILTAGDALSTHSLTGALIFDPARDRFSVLAPMTEPTRRDYAVTRLTDGRVLVPGGEVLEGDFYNPRPRTLRSAAIFTPVAAPNWRATTGLPTNPPAAAGANAQCAKAAPKPLETPTAGSVAGRVAFVGGGQQVWVMNADGSGLTRLSEPTGCDMYPTWSADGTHLAYSSKVADLEHRILSVAADGTDRRTLTEGYADSHPAWSPDGTQIAFIRGISNSRIYLMAADGSGIRAISPAALKVELVNHLTWSPDGRALLVSADSGDPKCRAAVTIFEVSAPTGRQIAANCAPAMASWSPSGRSAVWMGLEGDRVPQRRVVRLVDVDGSNARGIPALSDVGLVSWAGDDAHLLIRTNAAQICVVRIDGSERRCLVSDGANVVSVPAWTRRSHP